MTVELDIGIPVILPKKTLDNWLQKGFLISFIGLLELLLNSNKSLVEIVDDMQDGLLSERGIMLRCAFLVAGICSRGMIACGLIYLLLGLIGYNGETRRMLANRAEGLEKPDRKRNISI